MENSILKEHRHHESHGVLIYTRIFISRRQVSLLSIRNINVAMITNYSSEPGFSGGWKQVISPITSNTGVSGSNLVNMPNAHYADPVFSWAESRGV